ncbi:MAG: exosortase B [Methylococcales bacterium]|nr:MAG: exosortase B [Methylococcales bacterium]
MPMSRIISIGLPKIPYSVAWLLVFIGLVGLYVPTYWNLINGIWRLEDNAHESIIFLLFIYLIIRQGKDTFELAYAPFNVAGTALLFLGSLLYVIGRSQDIIIFEVGSQIPVFAGVLLLMQGVASVRKLWFPLFYLVFMLPLPSMVVDALTEVLKRWISEIAVEILYDADYPIARDGVIIIIAQYKLLVADACSGLNSMFSLSAIGLLYMYLAGRSGWLYNSVMLASIIPIAFVANLVRIIALILITYYFGDAAGQGFMHDLAGMVLLIVAVLLLFMLDGILVRWMSVSRPISTTKV